MTNTPAPAEPSAEQRREWHDAAADALGRVNGAVELHAALLALMLPAGSQRALKAWRAETETTPASEALLAHAGHLVAKARLPWFEQLLSRMRRQPLTARQSLLEASRRIMQARGTVRPIDRLHWLAMRQRLGGNATVKVKAAATVELSQLPDETMQAISSFTAFLSRLVPNESTDAASATAAAHWYESAMAAWMDRADLPACEAPDTDALVSALHELQALPWMQRPVLVRTWLDAAVAHSPYRRLGDTAADALRLACTLLDSPLPPVLAAHFVEST